MEDMASSRTAAKDRPITQDGMPPDNGDTIHIPKAFLQGTTFKEGDELILKVVAVSDEGLEVAYAKAPENESEPGSAGSELDALDAGDQNY